MLFSRAAMVDDTYGIMQVCMHMLAWQPSLFSNGPCWSVSHELADPHSFRRTPSLNMHNAAHLVDYAHCTTHALALLCISLHVTHHVHVDLCGQ